MRRSKTGLVQLALVGLHVVLASRAMAWPVASDPQLARAAGDGLADSVEPRLQAIRALAQSGQFSLAMTEVMQLEEQMPRLLDRLSLLEADIWLQVGDNLRAAHAFERAANGPHSSVRARGRVGRVRAWIRAQRSNAETELRLLMRQYPSLPEAAELQFELARARESQGRVQVAVATYQHLDLRYPTSAIAAQARLRLQDLRDRGVRAVEYTLSQRVDRAEQLLRNGPASEARAAIDTLQAQPNLPAREAIRLGSMANTLALREGRVGASSTWLLTSNPAQRHAEQAKVLQRLRALQGRRTYARLSLAQLLQIVRLAAPVGLTDTVDEALTSLVARKAPAQLRLRAAIEAAGVASESKVVDLLETAVGSSSVGVAARYHYARALERSGRLDDALTQHELVIQDDRQSVGYYALWAAQRLETLRGGRTRTPAASPASASVASRLDIDAPSKDEYRPVDDAELATLMEPLATLHGAAYPWIGRCVDLLRLGETEAAADEIHEVFLAWRQAHGRAAAQFGLEAVYRGTSRSHQFVSWQLRRQRRALDSTSLTVLAKVAEQLGDYGTAFGFAGSEVLERNPRAYAQLVEHAAERFHVDADLLFAVMRVESVYHRSIVSYAGAVGLMQIMPGTGRRIAYYLGDYDFSTAKLLDPATNVEFGAWYLASLLERFQGRLPLAIAAYNGGPHNVRKWLRERAPQMPLDAFLEEIPFEQTHRYVRRVLSYYAAYRAKSGKAMQMLDVTLPQPKTDSLAF